MAIHILSNIAWSKGNQTMKLGQLIEYNNRNIFLQNLCRKWCRENSSRPLLVFRKSLIWGKSRWSAPYFQYILIALNLTYNKCELYKTSDYWVKFRLNFNFSEKSLGLVVSRKIFLMLHLSTDQIPSSDCLCFLRYWTICVLQLFLTRLWCHKI